MKKPVLLLALVFALTIAGLASSSSTASASSHCTVSQHCPNGSTVQCTGPAGTCTTGYNYVECGGSRTYCPSGSPCTASIQCAYGGFIECSSQTYCEEGSDYVYCDGVGTLTCDECMPRIYCSIP